MSKGDFFRQAASDGRILPFGASHLIRDEEEKLHDPYASAYGGYLHYSGKLERIVEFMPAELGAEIEQFDTHMLEWLAVLLYVGKCSIAISVSEAEASGSGPCNRDNGVNLGVWDVGFDNLRSQLGFSGRIGGDGSEPISVQVISESMRVGRVRAPDLQNRFDWQVWRNAF